MIATSCTDAKILLHFLYIYIYITYHEALAFTFLSLTLYPPRDPMLAGYPVSVFIILYNICQSNTNHKQYLLLTNHLPNSARKPKGILRKRLRNISGRLKM